jgi:hypothetical protein
MFKRTMYNVQPPQAAETGAGDQGVKWLFAAKVRLLEKQFPHAGNRERVIKPANHPFHTYSVFTGVTPSALHL